jgi:DNA-binding response OmpR family regulator
MGILIVEDDDDQRNVMETLIKNDGHRDVLTAESGEIALSLLARGPGIQLDLILLDIYMPKIDGIESCVRIRGDARYRTVPIVMTTALADMKTVDRALKSGATDYLTKPLKVVDFLACVRAKLRLKAEFELHNLLQSEFASNFQQLGTLAGSQK